jgi:UDP-N-acetylglucosamine 4,6-dehydratase (inverting)
MNKKFFKNKKLLITGGTGSFGRALVEYLLKNKFPLKKLVILSRDELKQYEMNQVFSIDKFENIRYFLGDIRDKDRLRFAVQDMDIVIHAAALKQVPSSEYNPFEFIKTNILGSQNVIEACISSNVSNVVALSTDKASSPVNLYGATKLCSDKLFTSAQNIIGNRKLAFSVVRYGNVMFSRGSILPKLLNEKKQGYFSITDLGMTRFSITLNESVNFVLNSLLSQKGGEIFVPKIPSYRLLDLCKAVDKNCRIRIIGLRQGEKIHEEMIATSDSNSTFDQGKYYVIINPSNQRTLSYYKKNINFTKVNDGFSYNSGKNKCFLTVDKLKSLINITCGK